MIWHQAPFIRLLLPLIGGIVLAFYLPIALWGRIAPLLFLLMLPVSVWLAFRKHLSVFSVRFAAVWVSGLLFFLGYSLSYWQDARHQSNHVQAYLQANTKQTYLARVAETPKLKETTMRTELELVALLDSAGKASPLQGKIIATFRLDTFSAQLQYGDGLFLQTDLKRIGSPDNPHGYDAAAYYRLRNVYHQCFLSSDYWQPMPALNAGSGWKKTMLQWREYLVSIFEQHLSVYPNELAVATALVLGDKNQLSSDLRNAYTDTGATHVLAVSGLHVGLIAMGLGGLLQRLRRKKNMERKPVGEAVLLLIAIWFFALLTGASPSVMRASAMFSFVTLSATIGRKISIYNTLAASAFVLLCLQPTALWDIGFQLSYLAVLGIVYLHPLIYKKIYISNTLGDYIWNLTAVSLAAQVATLPISLFYFHQFPVYFWLSGLVVIPLATVIMPLGLLLLFLDAIPVLGTILGQLLYGSIALMNAGVFMIQQLPLSVVEGFWLQAWEMWLWYAVIFFILIAIATRKMRWIIVSCTFVLFLSMAMLWKTMESTSQTKMVVYKVYKGSLVDFIVGRKAYTLADSLHNSPTQLQFIHQNNLWAQGVRQKKVLTLYQDSIHNDFIYLNHLGIGQFIEKRFAILSPNLLAQQLAANQPLALDYLFLSGNAKIKDLSDLDLLFNYKSLVFDASNSPYRLALWRRQCMEEGIPFVDCSDGACTIYHASCIMCLE